MKRVAANNSLLVVCGAIISLVLEPSVATAHLVTTGMGPVYDGIGHLLLTPEDLLPALAVALYAGMLGTAAGQRALFLLPLAWLLGGLAGLFAESQSPPLLSALAFLTLGLLIAADLRCSITCFTVLTVGVGLVHGFFNGVSLQESAAALRLIGITAALFVLMAIVSARIVSLQQPWTRIVVRVSGSWMAAIGLLMVGWLVRGRS